MKRMQRAFKPTEENDQRLAKAVDLGISPSDVINEALAKWGDQIIASKAKKLRDALDAVIK